MTLHEPGPRFAGLGAQGDASPRGLQAEQAALTGRDPDRPATVAGVADRHHPRGHRRGAPTAGATGAVPGVPRVAGGAVRLGLGGGHQPELGRVGLAHGDEPGRPELGEQVAVVVGDVADLLQQPVPVMERVARRRTVMVLEDRRHTGERGAGGDLGRGDSGLVEEGVDHRVQLGVELLDPGDRGLDELGGRHRAAAHEIGLRGGVERCQVVMGVGHASDATARRGSQSSGGRHQERRHQEAVTRSAVTRSAGRPAIRRSPRRPQSRGDARGRRPWGRRGRATPGPGRRHSGATRPRPPRT